ncbi:nicotinamide/nicotinic acid mononucleotide adenylyltransferase 1-like [Watersipora subatra]|uniref:nicotinamide/nicotinic acid mononucleotide adenylyltransferase 1-like n=1 Tax=Watersipora subatra TaxID=2589382 RepID=UPI00355B025C
MASFVPKPVVLYCAGCFNPITNKHLRIMELARDALHKTGKYKVIKGIFSPAHDKYNKPGLLPATHRYEMAKLAVKSNPWLCVDSWEMEQSGWTPTQIALCNLRERIASGSLSVIGQELKTVSEEPQSKRRRQSEENAKLDVLSSETQVRLLIGGDVLESFSVPELWATDHMESIARDFGMVVIVREGSNPQKYIYESDMLSKYTHNIDIVYDMIGDDLSSTKMRRAIKRNESVKYLTPDAVIDYIQKHKLYNSQYQPGNLFPESS